MAVGTREVGLYGVVGVLIAALIIAALTISGVVIPRYSCFLYYLQRPA